MAKHLSLVISLFLFGIASVYPVHLPETDQTEKMLPDLSYKNFKFDQKLVDQHHSQEDLLSRVIRSNPSDPPAGWYKTFIEGPRRMIASEATIRKNARQKKEQERLASQYLAEQERARKHEESDYAKVKTILSAVE